MCIYMTIYINIYIYVCVYINMQTMYTPYIVCTVHIYCTYRDITRQQPSTGNLNGERHELIMVTTY